MTFTRLAATHTRKYSVLLFCYARGSRAPLALTLFEHVITDTCTRVRFILAVHSTWPIVDIMDNWSGQRVSKCSLQIVENFRLSLLEFFFRVVLDFLFFLNLKFGIFRDPFWFFFSLRTFLSSFGIFCNSLGVLLKNLFENFFYHLHIISVRCDIFR